MLEVTIKREWFDMILSGKKKEEYREIKPYWTKRLFYPDGNPVQYSAIRFRNGYDADSPTVLVWYEGVDMGKPNPDWCEPGWNHVYRLKLGEVISAENLRKGQVFRQ